MTKEQKANKNAIKIKLNVKIGEGSTENVDFEFSMESRQRLDRCSVIRSWQIVPDLRTNHWESPTADR
jgi:hypothetical protein